jgi:hypothetical protein
MAGIASVLLVALLCVVAGLWTKIQYLEWLKSQPPGVTARVEQPSDAEISSDVLSVVFALAMIVSLPFPPVRAFEPPLSSMNSRRPKLVKKQRRKQPRWAPFA